MDELRFFPNLTIVSLGKNFSSTSISPIFCVIASTHVQIEKIVIKASQSPFEEIKSAASYALGNIAVGNLPKYLPFILKQIDNHQKKQDLLLHSLKEVLQVLFIFYVNNWLVDLV